MSRPRADCGGETGYRAHLRHGEVPCQRCCDGHAVHIANWRARARVSAADDPPRYRAARLGVEPAEALTTSDRQRLVAELVRLQWSDARIADWTHMSTYTTTRIRSGLHLTANPRRSE